MSSDRKFTASAFALTGFLRQLAFDVLLFSKDAGEFPLRSYQEEVARAIVDSVFHRKGLSFVVMFPRQSGKNEVQALVESYLLMLYCLQDADIVKISPTRVPQSQTSMQRLKRRLEHNLLTTLLWKKELGYIFRVGRARITFLSGAPEANIVGATASLLLEVDEAQDVTPAKYDKEIAPMAASTNATRVFWGTAWTSSTLLARELRLARAAQETDGVRRVFVHTADDVAREVPEYGKFVAEEVERLGRSHPMVKSQFFCEEVDAETGLFPPARRALMAGSHPRSRLPSPGRIYAFLLDVAGQDEQTADGSGELQNPGRDATALTIVEVDLATCSDPLIQAPTYRAVDRRLWVGQPHVKLYGQIVSLAKTWNPYTLVVDATGIGAGLAEFLGRALPGRVIPFAFNAQTKSQLGWDFLKVVETGRFKDWAPGDAWDERSAFWQQLEACRSEVVPGPDHRMRWSVPDGARDPATGERIHDDLLISAAFCAELDKQSWPAPGGAVFVPRRDPLLDLDREGF